MRLAEFRLRNFRAFEDITVHVHDFTTLIGPNNVGKSSLLRGIEHLLAGTNLTLDEFRNANPALEVALEARFVNLQDWERQAPGVAGLVNENEIRLRKTFRWDHESSKVTSELEAFYRPTVIQGFGEAWNDVQQEVRQVAAQIGITTGTQWRTSANKERVRQRIRESRPDLITVQEPQWSADAISIPAALHQALPKPVMVPAIQNPDLELKANAKTAFGVLLSAVIEPIVRQTPEFLQIETQITALRNRLGSPTENYPEIQDITNTLSQRLETIIPASVRMFLDDPEIEKLVSGSFGLRLNDGHDAEVKLHGNGLQRTLLFALIEVVSRHQGQVTNGAGTNTRSTLMLFEEPELFIHPHLMRRLRNALVEISGADGWQVIATTHSPFLVNVAENPESLVILSKMQDENRTVMVRQLTANPFQGALQTERETLRATLDFHPTICEAFFADRVVLVEGDSEKAVFSHSDSRVLDQTGVPRAMAEATTIISCGGKWTILAMARLMVAFGISVRIVHDTDRRGRTQAELNNLTSLDAYNANARIAEIVGPESVFCCEDKLEDVLGIDVLSGGKDKPIRAWRAIEEIVSSANGAGSNPRLVELFQFVYGVQH